LKHITTDELKRMTDTEGLILQGCGGDPNEWVSGINEMFTEEGILLDGDTFKDIYVFEHDGLTNMLFSMEDVKLNMGKLAMWRLASHDTFGGTWLSDYLPNRLGINTDERSPDHNGADIDTVEPEEDAPPIVWFGERPGPYKDGFSSDGPYPDDRENASGHLSLRAYIVNTGDMADMYRDIDRLKDGGFAGKWHSFPTTWAEVQATLKEIGIDGVKYTDYAFNDFEGISESLRNVLPMFTDLDELNYLAVKLEGLTDPQREVFDAVVQSGKHCASLVDVINLTENLDCFDLQPAVSAEHYGEFLIETEKENTGEIFNRLERSKNQDERDFAKYVLRLEAHVDEAAYGRAVAEEENGVFTDHGYLTEVGEFNEVYRDPEDIPPEYRVFAYPEPEPRVKVENADLTALVTKIHALGGDYMTDANYNLNVLADRRSAEYLLLMNGRNIFLTEAAHTYRRGTTAFDVWMNAVEGPDTKAFAIHVTDMHDPSGSVIGNLVEVDLAEHQLDILHHSINHTRIDATPKYGPERSFTPKEWDNQEPVDRHMYQSWTRHFEHEDMGAVLRHLEELRGRHELTGKAVTPEALLSDLNRSYMEKAENTQPDMLRVNLYIAKDMLTRSDADVYRLMPGGPEKLSQMEALPSRGGLWHHQYCDFAIKREDMDGLDKWAKREANANIVKRQPEREAPEKPKSRGPEL